MELPEPTLTKLREPFTGTQISKLPKETRKQIDERKADNKCMVWKCDVCGGAHHKNAVHLDYVGHAALTDRLLDTDLTWSWEPVAFNQAGLPAFDQTGGLWIRLTVLGVTRLGYGSADGKSGGDAVKEIIGDALRNAAMRFGAALDLWHKGDLHGSDDDDSPKRDVSATGKLSYTSISADECATLRRLLKEADSSEEAFCDWLKVGTLPELAAEHFARAKRALEKRIDATKSASELAISEDDVPY